MDMTCLYDRTGSLLSDLELHQDEQNDVQEEDIDDESAVREGEGRKREQCEDHADHSGHPWPRHLRFGMIIRFLDRRNSSERIGNDAQNDSQIRFLGDPPQYQSGGGQKSAQPVEPRQCPLRFLIIERCDEDGQRQESGAEGHQRFESHPLFDLRSERDERRDGPHEERHAVRADLPFHRIDQVGGGSGGADERPDNDEFTRQHGSL